MFLLLDQSLIENLLQWVMSDLMLDKYNIFLLPQSRFELKLQGVISDFMLDNKVKNLIQTWH